MFNNKEATSLFKFFVFTFIAVFVLTLFLSGILRKSTDKPTPYMSSPTELLGTGRKSEPVLLRGISLDKSNPLKINFIVDEGNLNLSRKKVKEETKRLVAYFLSALTIPDQDLWVNLSPYEKDRVIPDSLIKTDMGRDLLAEDYMLKQLSSSLTHPDTSIGQNYWSSHQKSTFNKIWIVPEKAEIFEEGANAIIGNASLDVKTAKDFFASKRNNIKNSISVNDDISGFSEILNEIKNEVNCGEYFSRLRQIYHSLLLASWFKQRVSDKFYNNSYLDKSKLAGIEIDDPNIKQKIFEQYLKSFEKGVYNFIRNEKSEDNKVEKRSYFSGGMDMQLGSTLSFFPMSQYQNKIKSCSAVEVVLEPVVDPLLQNQDHDFTLREIIEKRKSSLEYAVGELNKFEKPEINFMIHTQGNYGVMGKAVLLANSLLNKQENLVVNIYVRMAINGYIPSVYKSSADGRLKINYIHDHNMKEFDLHEKIDAVFLAERTTEANRYKNAVQVLPYSYTLGEMNAEDRSSKIITDLTSKNSTLIVDHSLREKRLERGAWSKEDLLLARHKWLEKKELGFLAKIAQRVNLDIADSIWTYAYIQKLDSFKHSAKQLAKAYDNSANKYLSKSIPLVMHTVLGRHCNEREFKALAKELGINVLTDEGYLIKGELPIIVVLHKKIFNDDVRTLVSELSGTTMKTKDGKKFIDFPLFVTGNASWLEALSAGAIWLHDDNDTLKKKSWQFKTLAMKQRILAKETGQSIDEDELDIDHLLMDRVSSEPFNDLEKWTERAERYSDFVFKLSMADEILIKYFERKNKEKFSLLSGTETKTELVQQWISESSIAYETANSLVVYKADERYEFDSSAKEFKLVDNMDASKVYSELLQLLYPKLYEKDSSIILQNLKSFKRNDLVGLLWQLSQRSFQSFEFVRTVAEQRQKMLNSALAIVDKEKPHINIYVQQQGGNGVIGMASILSDSLLSSSKTVKTDIIVIANSGVNKSALFNAANDRKRIIALQEGTEDFDTKIKEADLHIVVSGNGVDSSFLPEKAFVIDVPGYAIAPSYFSSVNGEHNTIINNNVANPLGSLILNKSLLERMHQHDNLSLSQLVNKRSIWLEKNLTTMQKLNLDKLSENKWDPSKSIWSFAYFQESGEFLKELYLIKMYMEGFPTLEGGKQLLINMVCGEKITDVSDFIDSLKKAMVKVIDSDGLLHSNAEGDTAPVTIVMHRNLQNESVLENVIDLGGTSVRASNNKFWIDYPVYITGQASWLEALAAAKIYVHDGNDTGPGVKLKQLQFLARHTVALGNEDNSKTWQNSRVEVNEILNSTFMHGLFSKNMEYKDLEAWTKKVRRRTELIYKLNMADDILIDTANLLLEEHNTGEELSSAINHSDSKKKLGGIALNNLFSSGNSEAQKTIQFTNRIDIPEGNSFCGFSFDFDDFEEIEDPLKLLFKPKE